jgi:hypothetical protein
MIDKPDWLKEDLLRKDRQFTIDYPVLVGKLVDAVNSNRKWADDADEDFTTIKKRIEALEGLVNDMSDNEDSFSDELDALKTWKREHIGYHQAFCIHERFSDPSQGARILDEHAEKLRKGETPDEGDERCRSCQALYTTIDERDEAYDEIDRLKG